MFESFSADLRHYIALPGPERRLTRLRELLLTQGVWAIAVYRFGHWVHTAAPRPVAAPLKLPYLVAQKLIEITTGIRIPARATIGPGLYVGHFGTIILHADTVMGAGCSVTSGVTIGVVGNGRQGVPRIGDRVAIGTGAKLLGPITVGDGALIGANAVVVDDVPAGATVIGVPARVHEKRASLTRPSARR
jgi:serine O-acetyltransferase